MKVVAFIEPPQGKVVEKILRHCGLWQALSARAPPEVEDLVLDLDVAYSDSSPEEAGQFQELTYVDIDTFLTTFLVFPDVNRAEARCAAVLGLRHILR